jgi:IS5 family transposase
LHITRQTLRQAQPVYAVLHSNSDPRTQRVAQQLADFSPLVEQVIAQATQRVLEERSVPAAAKVVSLFEPHTQILRRGKAPPRDTEFGHKVNYAEVEGGLLSDWQVIGQGNPSDADLLPTVLRQHCQCFRHAPDVLAADRGAFSPENEHLAQKVGVTTIAIPQRGTVTKERKAQQRTPAFKKGQRFRNGIEGRISVLIRTVQIRHCPYHGLDGFERWIGWGVLVANLSKFAQTIVKRHRRKRHVKNEFSDRN